VEVSVSKKKRVGQAYRGSGRHIEKTPELKVKRTKWVKSQLDMFWYWLNTRHRIYLDKKAGDPWPWTKDKILRTYKFTNVYRQLDRVTQEWTTRYMKLRHGKASRENILFHCMVFRLFNWPPTYDTLNFAGLINSWNMNKAIRVLTDRKENGNDDERQIFTGAYIIPNGGSTDPKIDVICGALDWVHRHRKELMRNICEPVDSRKKTMLPSMEQAVNVLSNIWTIGPFIAYEIACDLRHTSLLADASDVMSWANPGPGAKRGIHRLMCGEAKMPGAKPNYNKKMRELLLMAPQALDKHVFECEWPFEMREIEHSLCEFDKYMRVKNDEGRPRSKYKTPDERWEDTDRQKDEAWEREKATKKRRERNAKTGQGDMFD
jgi:hypothetical protein